MQIEHAEGRRAWARGRQGRQQLDTALVGTVQPGDWVLVHLDSARERIDAQRAAEIDEALDLLEAVISGDGASASTPVSFELPSALSAEQLLELTGSVAPAERTPQPARIDV